MSYWYNLGVAFDQLANAFRGGAPDETLSSRWGRTRDASKIADLASRALNRIDLDHAFDAIEVNPRTGAPEPHHLGDYEKRREREEACLLVALASEEELDEETMALAEMAALRQRLREASRDKYGKRS